MTIVIIHLLLLFLTVASLAVFWMNKATSLEQRLEVAVMLYEDASACIAKQRSVIDAIDNYPIGEDPPNDQFLELASLRQELVAEKAHSDSLNAQLLAAANELAHEKRSNAALRGAMKKLLPMPKPHGKKVK